MTSPDPSSPSTVTPDPPPSGTSRIMQRAMFWNLLNIVFSQSAGFIIFLTIAARVPPHIFGIVALAALAADFVAMEGRYAAVDAILQARRYDRKSLNAAFSAFLAIAIALTAMLWVTAAPLAEAYSEPLIAAFMPLFGLMLIPVPWLAVMDAIMMRDLRYRQVAERSIGATIISGAVGIGLAFSPWLIWALFAQRLTSLIVAVALQYRYTRWLPQVHFDGVAGLDFIRRFLTLWTIGALTITISRVTLLVFGMRYDVATAGLLRATNRIAEAIQGPIISPLTGLWFPLMSRAKDDIDAERDVYNNILRTAAFVSLPTFAGLAIVATDMVAVLLPPQYEGVAPMLRTTAITLLLVPVLWYNTVAMSSLGMNKASLSYTIVLVLCSLATLLAFPRASPPDAILITSVPCAIVGLAGNILLNHRLRQTNVAHYAGLLPAVFATGAMSALTCMVAYVATSWHPAPRLLLCVAFGGAAYAGWLWAFHRNWFIDRVQLLRGRGR